MSLTGGPRTSGENIRLQSAAGTFSPPTRLRVGSREVQMHGGGADLPVADFELLTKSNPGWRFLRSSPSRAVCVPAGYRVASIDFEPITQDSIAEVLVKRSAEPWSSARPSKALAVGKERRVSLDVGLGTGSWDLAILFPMFEPTFATGIEITEKDVHVDQVKLVPGTSIHAAVRDAQSGQALKSWKAFLSPSIPNDDHGTARAFFSERPIADSAGDLSFLSLPKGTWELDVEAEGYATQRRRIGPVVPGTPHEVGVIYLGRPGELRVALTFPRGRPDGPMSVDAYRRTEDEESSQPLRIGRRDLPTTEPIATEFDNLEPGTYTVEVEGARGVLRREADIVVEGGFKALAEIEIAPVMLNGTVLKGRKPVTGAKVKVGEVEAVTKEDGQFQIQLWSGGSYLLLTFPPGAPVPVVENLEIPADEDNIVHDISLPGSSVKGKVSDAKTGEPVPNVKLAYSDSVDPSTPDHMHFNMETSTDQQGTYVIENLKAEPIDISASAAGYSTELRQAVMPSDESTSVDIAMSPGQRLKGRVVGAGGEGVAGAFVGLGVAPGSRFFEHNTSTKADGTFVFDDVAKGQQLVVTSACGYRLDVRTAPDDDSEMLVSLAPSSPTRLHVKTSAGKPLANTVLAYYFAGSLLPTLNVAETVGHCGFSTTTTAAGDIQIDFLPLGEIGVLDAATGAPVGSFENRGQPDESVPPESSQGRPTPATLP
jgi:hypothetical protein